MSSYDIRVELRGTPRSDVYDRLHAALGRLGAARIVRGDDGVWYDLPHGCYLMESSYDGAAVERMIRQAASSIWTDVLIYVTMPISRWWTLKPTRSSLSALAAA